MIRSARTGIRASRGQRLRIVALALPTLAGALLCLLSVGALDPGPSDAGATQMAWWFVAGGVGVWLVLRFNLGRFGWPRPRGWARMAGGVLFVTFFAPVLAGTLVLPLYGTMFGPLALWIMFLRQPVLAIAWFGVLVAAHLLMQHYRRERATIFLHPSDPG